MAEFQYPINEPYPSDFDPRLQEKKEGEEKPRLLTRERAVKHVIKLLGEAQEALVDAGRQADAEEAKDREQEVKELESVLRDLNDAKYYKKALEKVEKMQK